ncbi:ATP-binding protein [Marinobacter lacisalsi]|uniref:ATP-binding protein n=1 Tax=Marinobacter lacisalsi TaxID=475979 RepID=A0ABV8QK58_9GAMM
MPRQWPPASLLSAGLTIGVLLALTAVYLATHLPRVGIHTEPGTHGVRVMSVADDSGVQGRIRPGQEIIALRNGDEVFRLEPGDAIAEPDDAPVYKIYNRFFERQAIIWELLRAPDTELAVINPYHPPQLLANSVITPVYLPVSASHASSLSGLPASFWIQLICGLSIFWMGVGAWAFVQNEPGPRFYALAGLALALAIIASAIYTTRELAMEPGLFLTLSRINQFGAMLFAGAGTALLWYYPTRLGRWRFERFMVPAVALILAANWGQWSNSLDLTARVSLMGWAALDVILAFAQWHRTRTEPVARARLKWFVFSWFGGVLGYLGLVVAPQLLGQPSLIHQQWAWILFVLSYLGIAMGIVRFRLFDLDRWILMAWFWFICGVMVIALDAILIVFLDMSTSLSLLVTLALAGWLYFPLRQLFLRRLMPRTRRDDFSHRLPELTADAFDTQNDIDQEWRTIIQRSLQPLHMEQAVGSQSVCTIDDNGLRLRVPTPSGSSNLVLGYAEGGQRLFDRNDLAFVDQTLMLFRYAANYRDRFRQGVMEERKRVARDLHDDVGARLLSVIYRAGETETGKLARECLVELRDVIQGLQKQHTALEQSFNRWYSEACSRCQLFGVTLDMTLDTDAGALTLSPRSERNLMRILREFITNTLKHAEARYIRVSIHDSGTEGLIMDCYDDGCGIGEPEASGVGIYSMEERALEIGGTAHWYCPLSGGTGLRCQIPVDPVAKTTKGANP